ncbi:MAG: hypothetical protein WDN03_13925 [Rhizomicrobium sp.]
MPELQEDMAAFLVDGVHDGLPAFGLFVGPDARRVGIADAHRLDRGGLGHDQAGAGALGVIFDGERRRHAAAFQRAGARQRRHPDAIGQGERAHLDGVEQGRHRESFGEMAEHRI